MFVALQCHIQSSMAPGMAVAIIRVEQTGREVVEDTRELKEWDKRHFTL